MYNILIIAISAYFNRIMKHPEVPNPTFKCFILINYCKTCIVGVWLIIRGMFVIIGRIVLFPNFYSKILHNLECTAVCL